MAATARLALLAGPGVDLAINLAILEDRPYRFTCEHAAHITEILCATSEAAKTGRPVDVVSDFARPMPWEWAS